MLERLVAAIVLIGALLWGASLLATPEEGARESLEGDEAAEATEASPDRLPDVDEPDVAEDDGDEGDEDDSSGSDNDHERKGKRGPG